MKLFKLNSKIFNALQHCIQRIETSAYTQRCFIKKNKKMSDIKEITEALIKFRNERDWEQFHNPKDLAVALSIEASELLENFLWKSHEEADKGKVKEELADVIAYSLLLAEKYGFDVKDILLNKIKKNGEKYPIEKAKGTAKKYNEL